MSAVRLQLACLLCAGLTIAFINSWQLSLLTLVMLPVLAVSSTAHLKSGLLACLPAWLLACLPACMSPCIVIHRLHVDICLDAFVDCTTITLPICQPILSQCRLPLK